MKHWMSYTRIYSIWTNMKARCNNPNRNNYIRYWARWIKCEWNSFEEFYTDMWPTYQEWLTLDRRKNNLNYCKSNCKWSTVSEQNRNKRTNRIYQWKCIAQWCEDLWLNYWAVRCKLYRGQTIKQALWL